jgi:hypothetical protein
MCKLCGETSNLKLHDIFIPADEDHEGYTATICTQCWDIVQELARRQTNERFNEIEERLTALEQK